MAAPRRSTPGSLQLSADLLEVVDLAVVGHDVAAADGMHRLMTLRRHVDDGQPTVGQCKAMRRIEPRTCTVGPSVRQAGAHSVGHFFER